MNYYITKKVQGEFGQVKDKVIGLLKEEGFGIKTEIDMASTFQEKLGVEHRPYFILGACNPGLAHQALEAEDKVGVLLPCNVLLIEQEPGVVEVAAMDVEAMMGGIGNPRLEDVAAQVGAHMKRVIDRA